MKSDWELLQALFKERFGSTLEIDAIIFIIGLQELGKPHRKYKKDEKIAIMHVAVCTLLEPFGFYKYLGNDADGWPHWELVESLPALDAKQQNRLMVDAIIDYFKKDGFLVSSVN